MIRCIFGAKGQLVVGILMIVVTGIQTIYWTLIDPPPGFMAIFLVSMEALFFAGFNQICGALGYRKTEHVIEKLDGD